jgi:ATP-dependent DNA helicase RecQ
MMGSPQEILQQYWGHARFRPLQEEIIQSVLDKNDTVALLPTGGGKSICFQIPALVQEGICIVVSPLIALMNDQVNALTKMGIKSMALTGGISYNDLDRLLDNCIYGNYKFLYLSPERLQQELVQHRIEKMEVNLIAIDEAHCISQWGNDFRPAFKNIAILKSLKPNVPFIAVTATATPEVLTDTIQELQLDSPKVFQKSFYRENLSYQVWKEEDKYYRLEQLLKSDEPSIIYTRNRKSTEEISKHLNLKGINCSYFHGGISADDKNKRLKNWLNETTPVIVATSAFGMGIDKANVRTVIHVDLPESLESYFQEAGRAGRDGNYSKAILLYNQADKGQVVRQFISTLPTRDFLKHIYKRLCNHFYIAYGEGEFTTHAFNFEKFCLQYELHTMKTYNAIQALDRLSIIKLSFEFGRKTEVQFLIPSKKVISYLETNMKISIIGKTILRIYTGIFEKETAIDLELISSKSGQSTRDIIDTLKQFEKDQIISLSLLTTDTTLTFIEPREDDRTINRIAKTVERLNTNKKDQVGSVLTFIENEKVCKSIQLLQYFGDFSDTPCGICSVCAKQQTSPSIKEVKLIAGEILVLLEQQTFNSREICERLTFAESKVIFVLHQLMDANKITLTLNNKYTLR